VKDIKLYIEKLHSDAEDCMAISRTAPREAKRKIFTALADTYLRLAGELEKIAAANVILDEERDKNLLGLLGGEGPLGNLCAASKASLTRLSWSNASCEKGSCFFMTFSPNLPGSLKPPRRNVPHGFPDHQRVVPNWTQIRGRLAIN
jgi:hypothetical protein